jgi:hypothetical protein
MKVSFSFELTSIDFYTGSSFNIPIQGNSILVYSLADIILGKQKMTSKAMAGTNVGKLLSISTLSELTNT